MQASPLFLMMRRAALPALCLLVAGYFVMHALFGPTGLFELDSIRAERAGLAAEHADLQRRKAELQRDIRLLNPGGADRDYADELVRRHLGVIRPDEIIVPLTPAKPETEASKQGN